MRIRSHLLALSAVVLIPSFLAAAVAVRQVRDRERETALRGLRETVRATALLVEGQVQRSIGALTVLASSPHLASEALDQFHRQALATDLPPDVWTVLVDETGQQRVNTLGLFGTPLPLNENIEHIERSLRLGAPVVTGVGRGPLSGKLRTTIYVPARPTASGRRFVVGQSFSVDHWKRTAMQPGGRASWIVAVIDRDGQFISRSHRTDELLGKSARPELVAAAAAADEGLIRHQTLEGTEVFDAFTHSPLTGWTIAVAAPVETIEASATQAVGFLAGGVAAALAAALIAASMLSRRLIRAMAAASNAAGALGRGEKPEPPSTPIDEVNALNRALSDAGALILSERAARATAEKDRQALLVNERAAREKAQAENAAKDQFLALLGHELRNPLSAITGATEVLATIGDETKKARLFAILRRQNRHLKHIVDDLLEVSRMLSGRIVLETAPIDAAACVRSCIESIASSETAAKHPLTVNASEAWVNADAVRLEQVVTNLVVNALKFSAPGQPVVVRVRPEGEHVVIEVADSGLGVDPSMTERIFEPFVQGPALSGRQASGLGIGLALVKQLVTLHGGTVTVRPTEAGCGATFAVHLPRIDAPASDTASDEKRSTPAAWRVLLVEDDADAREATVELLRASGYEVAFAEDGDSGLIAAAKLEPNVIVMDIGMPGRSGLEIALELRRTPALKHIPLIALSGYGQPRDREASLAAGFDVHLVKPVEIEVLRAAINRLCGR